MHSTVQYFSHCVHVHGCSSRELHEREIVSLEFIKTFLRIMKNNFILLQVVLKRIKIEATHNVCSSMCD